MLPPPPAFLASALAAPIAILGDGVSGQAVRALLAALKANGTAYDSAGTQFTPAAAARHHLVVYSPGFAPGHPWLEQAVAAGCLCLAEIDFAFLFWRGRVLAVSGTNGKTTLTEFLAHALTEAGLTAVAAGNIGYPFCRLVAEAGGGSPEMIAVCEISSFQAETLRHFRAEATLWTNFAEDHLERHGTMEAYFAAKAVLAGRSRRLFAGSSVKAFADALSKAALSAGASAKEELSAEVLAKTEKIWVPTERQPPDRRLNLTVFEDYPQRENFLLADAWWRAEERDPATLTEAARSFRLGRHRLSRVAEIDGVTFWNDSKATNFHAVEAALGRFQAPAILIAGGRAKGGDLRAFVHRIGPKVRHFFLLGETAAELGRGCAAEGLPHTFCATLAEAVAAAALASVPGEHVLLSPGFASFDMFRNYQDRGDQFETLVQERRLTAKAPC